MENHYTDFHCHLLPNMDDGCKSPEESAQLWDMMQSQGISKAWLTSHFYPQNETVDSFLSRRTAAFQRLKDACGSGCFVLGAEVYMVNRIGEMDNIDKLTIGNTKNMLLELPYRGLPSWALQEISSLAYDYQCKPILAHLDRYIQWFTKQEVSDLLRFPGIVIQVNADALLNRPSRKFVLELIRSKTPVVLGSDSHNITTRPPHYGKALAMLQSKLGAKGFEAFVDMQKQIGG